METVESTASISPFVPYQIHGRAWGEEWIVAQTPTALGKVLRMKAGKTGALQHHVEKDESFFLESGKLLVEYLEDGRRVQVEMTPGQAFHIPPGAVHRVEAVEDSVLFEVGNVVFNDRVSDEASVD